VANLTPEDLREIKKQQEQFAKLWQNIGPKLVNIYSERNAGTNELKEIDQTFTAWRNAINREAWNSIRLTFADYGINLRNFNSGNEFTQAAVSFIKDEIKSAGIKTKQDAENIYKSFADSAWYGEVKPIWVSYLLENNMFSEAQKDSVENKISDWKAAVYGGGTNWLYIIIGVLVVVFAVLLIIKSRPKKGTGEKESS
jgi:hypothetical protein